MGSEKGMSAEQFFPKWQAESGWYILNTQIAMYKFAEAYAAARLREVEGERDRAVKDKLDNIEKWIEQAGELRQDISDFIEKLRSAEEEGDRQRAALEKFGVHGSDCNYFHAWNDRNKVCDCGLDELLGKKPLKMC